MGHAHATLPGGSLPTKYPCRKATERRTEAADHRNRPRDWHGVADSADRARPQLQLPGTSSRALASGISGTLKSSAPRVSD